MANKTGKGGFGDHKEHIWRKGTPESYNEFHSLAQAIANEKASRDGQPVIYNGHIVTIAELILRSWATSKDPRLQQAFVAYAYGKVPTQNEITGAKGDPIKFIIELDNGQTD